MIIYGVDVRCHYDNGNVRVAHRYTRLVALPESTDGREVIGPRTDRSLQRRLLLFMCRYVSCPFANAFTFTVKRLCTLRARIFSLYIFLIFELLVDRELKKIFYRFLYASFTSDD